MLENPLSFSDVESLFVLGDEFLMMFFWWESWTQNSSSVRIEVMAVCSFFFKPGISLGIIDSSVEWFIVCIEFMVFRTSLKIRYASLDILSVSTSSDEGSVAAGNSNLFFNGIFLKIIIFVKLFKLKL